MAVIVAQSRLGEAGFGEVVTITRPGLPGLPDEYGNPTHGPNAVIDVVGCLFAPDTSNDETGPDGRVIVSPAAVYAGIDAPFAKDDRLTIRGDDGWFVDGEPQVWRSPWTTSTSGVRVFLRRRS